MTALWADWLARLAGCLPGLTHYRVYSCDAQLSRRKRYEVSWAGPQNQHGLEASMRRLMLD